MNANTKALTNFIDKKANVLSQLGRIFDYSRAGLKGAAGLGLGAGLASATLESGGRTINNALHGHLEMGGAPWTGRQVGHLTSAILNATGAGPALGSASDSVLNSVDKNPNAQKVLDSLSNITNPTTRNEFAEALIDKANEKMGPLYNEAGKEFGKGIFSSTMQDMANHPVKSILGATALSAGPVMAYDAITRKHRKEEAERTNALLQMLTHKQASVLDRIVDNPLFKKYINRPSNIGVDKLQELISNAKDNAVPLNILQKNVNHPNTLLNNFITRNPVKSLMIPSAILGSAETIAERQNDNSGNFDTLPKALTRLGSNVFKTPANLIEGIEGAGAENINFDKSNSVQKIKQIGQNINDSFKPGLPVAPSKPATGWEALKPYLVAGGIIGAPTAAIGAYNHYHNKDIDNLNNENKMMQNKVRSELANV
jgi:hypothetical protein